MSDSKTYMANEQNSSQGLVVLEEFREETKKPMECTTELLMKLLQDNKDTEYGKKYGFADIHTIFISNDPVYNFTGSPRSRKAGAHHYFHFIVSPCFSISILDTSIILLCFKALGSK